MIPYLKKIYIYYQKDHNDLLSYCNYVSLALLA